MARTPAQIIGRFGAITCYMVEPGTEVQCDLTGEKLIVTDDAVVFGGGRAWITPKVYQALKDDPRSSKTHPLKEAMDDIEMRERFGCLYEEIFGQKK